MERLTHRQIQELLGAYALDAVDDDEAELVELHLRDCPRCRAEVEDHREAAAMLAHVGAPAPAGVWNRIAAQLVDDAPDYQQGVGASPAVAPPGAASPPSRRFGVLRGSGRRIGPGSAPPSGPGSVRGVPFRVASAALAAAAVLVAVLGVQVARLDHRLDRMVATVSRNGINEAALAAMADPGARRVHLKSDDSARQADAVLLPDGQAYLVGRSLPALSADQTYQLWAVVGDQKISVGVLGPSPAVAAFRYSADPSLLAITAEKAGGVIASDKVPVVVGAVPPTPA
jgi:anti-sigma-K factor RskA